MEYLSRSGFSQDLGTVQGRDHRESDVDLAVLLRPGLTREERFETRLALTSSLIAALHCNDVDLVVLNHAHRCGCAR